jgi:uncharacterized membrane protein
VEAPAPIAATVVTWMHVVCGSVVLAVAPLALLVRKGSWIHRRFGRVFMACMFVVAISALFMWQKKGHLFLVFLDVVVVYLFVYGSRIVKRRRSGFLPEDDRLDRALAVAVIFAGLLTIWVGFGIATPLMRDLRWVLLMLGGIGLWFGGWDLYSLVTKRLTPTGWLFLHMTAMISAYISAVTAFIVINAHDTPMIVRWMVPIAIGGATVVAFQLFNRNRLTPRKAAPTGPLSWLRKYFWDIIPPPAGEAKPAPGRSAATSRPPATPPSAG